jgi:hypothetical protein
MTFLNSLHVGKWSKGTLKNTRSRAENGKKKKKKNERRTNNKCHLSFVIVICLFVIPLSFRSSRTFSMFDLGFRSFETFLLLLALAMCCDFPLTTWSCKPSAKPACLFRNLYYVDGRLVAHVSADHPKLGNELMFESGVGIGMPTISVVVTTLQRPAACVPVTTSGAAILSIVWPNIMRTIYPAAAAYATARMYGLSLSDCVLVENFAEHPRFADVLRFAFDSVAPLQTLPAKRWATIVIGIAFSAKVLDSPRMRSRDLAFGDRASGYDAFRVAVRKRASAVLMKTSRRLTITLVVRRNTTRRFLNENDVVSSIRRLAPLASLNVVDFGVVEFEQQVSIATNSDLLIAMHGAALAHVFFMRPGTAVLEMFPFEFHKDIYLNLAMSLGVQYLSWQSPLRELSVFDWDAAVSVRRWSDVPQEVIVSSPLMWRNMDSRNYYRSQSVNVQLDSFESVLRQALRAVRGRPPARFLLFMPWEQFNNQLIGIRCACAIAEMLQRTLVLPKIAFRHANASWSFAFHPEDYSWHAIEDYLNITSLHMLPCRVIELSNFQSVWQDKRVNAVFTRPTLRSTEDELLFYYKKTCRLNVTRVERFSTAWPTRFETKADVLSAFRRFSTRPALALGAAFWMYIWNKDTVDFDMSRKRGIFVDMIADPSSRVIRAGLQFHRRIVDAANQAVARLGKFVAVHIRRGDYAIMCGTFEPHIDPLCLPENDLVVEHVERCTSSLNPRVVYVCSNDDITQLLDDLRRRGISSRSMADIEDLIPAPLREHDKSMVEQLIAASATEFIGVFSSSWTRYVVEERALLGRASHFFAAQPHCGDNSSFFPEA